MATALADVGNVTYVRSQAKDDHNQVTLVSNPDALKRSQTGGAAPEPQSRQPAHSSKGRQYASCSSLQLGRLHVQLTKHSHRPDVRLAFGTALQIEFCTPADGSMPTLDRCLQEVLPGLTDVAREAIAGAKRIKVHDRIRTRLEEAVLPGSKMCLWLPPVDGRPVVPQDLPVEVLAEDDHILVVNKPAGILTHPSMERKDSSLVNWLLHRYGLPVLNPYRIANTPATLVDLEKVLTASPEDQQHRIEQIFRPLITQPYSHLPVTSRHALWCMLLNGKSNAVKPGIVQRIDAGTSGVVVLAKTRQALEHLTEQFRNHSPTRIYQSIHLLSPGSAAGVVRTNTARGGGKQPRRVNLEHGGDQGLPTASSYKVLDVFGQGAACKLEWQLQTGRSHQIRLHAEHLGVPLLGDKVYGLNAQLLDRANRLATWVSREQPQRGRALGGQVALLTQLHATIGRPALHAKLLRFVHPSTGQQVTFSIDQPKDFKLVVHSLRRGLGSGTSLLKLLQKGMAKVVRHDYPALVREAMDTQQLQQSGIDQRAGITHRFGQRGGNTNRWEGYGEEFDGTADTDENEWVAFSETVGREVGAKLLPMASKDEEAIATKYLAE